MKAPGARIVVASGPDDEDFKERALRLGAAAVLPRAGAMASLPERMREILARLEA